jgi:predicted permease
MPLLLDLRHSLRSVIKAPGFLIASTLSLALGIGVNTATFSALQAGLSARLGWKDPASLVFVGRKDAAYPMLSDTLQVTYARFKLWQERQSAVSPLAAWTMNPTVLSGSIEPRSILALRVSPEFWPMVGARPLLGRLPDGAEEGVFVATRRLWSSALGADPSVIGKAFRVGGDSRTLIGVLPATVVWTGAEIFVPLEPTPDERDPTGWNFLSVGGRMRPGLTYADVQAAFRTLNAQMQSSVASERNQTAVPKPLLEAFYGRFRGRQQLLAWVALFVGVLACVNLCNLALGRTAARLQELGIRQALGASRRQLFLPVVSDLLLAAIPGIALGWVFSAGTGRLLEAFVPGDFRIFLGMSATDLVAGAAVALALSLIGAAIPALLIPRMHVSAILAGARASGGRAGRRTQRTLVAVQVGLALTLLSSFSLVWLSLRHLKAAPIGIAAESRVLATLSLPLRTPDEEARRASEIAQALEKIRALPGVKCAGGTDLLPVIAGGNNGRVRIPGREQPAFSYFRGATDGYFECAGIPLLEGRTFRSADLAGSTAVIVSQSFAARLLPARAVRHRPGHPEGQNGPHDCRRGWGCAHGRVQPDPQHADPVLPVRRTDPAFGSGGENGRQPEGRPSRNTAYTPCGMAGCLPRQSRDAGRRSRYPVCR